MGNVELYNGHKLTMKYYQSGRYGVQCTADECLLTINTVQTRDQGEYSCFFPRSRQRQDFWLLVVGKLLVLSQLILELYAQIPNCDFNIIIIIIIIIKSYTRYIIRAKVHKNYSKLG